MMVSTGVTSQGLENLQEGAEKLMMLQHLNMSFAR